MKRWLIILFGVAIAVLTISLDTIAQTEGILYGKVTTESTEYTGPIRWGNEEVFWTDLFNASKTDAKFEKMIEERDKNESLSDYDWNFKSIWEDNAVHRFTCQFGNIKTLAPLGKSRVRLTFKNNEEATVQGEGYNDIGTRVYVLDEELGTIGLDWERIEKIEFMQAPKKLPLTFGVPLFGTVETIRGEKLKGYVVWDEDERVGTDKLDGDSDDGKVSLKFQDIASIEHRGRGSEVKLKSGRELYLDGSNDVADGHRGVIVMMPGLGIAKLPWSAFEKVTFTEPEFTMPDFEDFASGNAVSGTVSRLDGSDLTGQIVYDLDEEYDFEIIEGKDNEIEYMIPMSNIKKISPKNADFSIIELRSGKTILLGEQRDVSSGNSGIMVMNKAKKQVDYVRWRQLNEIIFK